MPELKGMQLTRRKMCNALLELSLFSVIVKAS